MSDDADFSVESTPSLQDLATFHADEVFSVERLARLEQVITNAIQKGSTVAKGAEFQAAKFLAELLGKFLETIEEHVEPVMGPFLSTLAGRLIGVNVSTSELRQSAAGGGETTIGTAVAAMAFKAMGTPAGELEPGDGAAKKMIGMLAQLTFNGWFDATAFEMIATLFPDMDSFESVAELPDKLVNSLGLGRLARTALRPLAQIAVATPLQWQLNKSHRPNLLSEGDIIKAFQRGDYTGDEAAEELARLGYSDRRQDMLIKSAAKRLSLDDALYLARTGVVDSEYPLQNLRDEGYDESTAQLAVTAGITKRADGIRDNALTAVTRAFVNRDIDDGAFLSFIPAIVPNANDQDTYHTVARTERDLNVKHLSHAEVVECVELLILPTAYYRTWLAREGYPDDEATALELRLLAKIEKIDDVKKERARIEQEKADAKAAADKAKADRAAAIEAERQLHARGSISDLTRAVVRGLIPMDRLAEVLRASYDADTVGIVTSLAETDRAAYVAQQEAAAQARQRAANRNIDIGAIEQAVLASVLSIDDFKARLAQLNFAPADAAILAATVAAKKKDLDDARAKRVQADAAAKSKSIDLARAEQLIIRGHHTMAEYNALLTSLGFEPGARAQMAELLQLKVADYAQAQQARAAAAAKDANKGVTLEQLRRAVVLGVRTVDDYQRLLVDEHFTSDAQATLLAALRADVDEAVAARRRRQTADNRGGAPRVSLAQLARAAQLGIVTPAAYRARLVADGYSPDDVAVEMDLLTVEIADAVARRARRDALEQQAQDRGLSLSEIARAVKAGAASIETYRARAAELNYAADDIDLLVAVLEDELAAQADAEARRTTIDGELGARNLSLAELEAAVTNNLRTIAQYQAQLEQWGYAATDAQLLTSLLATKLAAHQTKASGG